MGKKRKQVQLTSAEKAKLLRFAEVSETTWPVVVRQWAEAFVKNGTGYVAPTYERLQIFLDDELRAAVDARCETDGVTLQNVIQHEIAELDQL